MSDKKVVFETKLEFGVVVYDGVHLEDILEKPTVLVFDDGSWAYKDKSGRIVEKK